MKTGAQGTYPEQVVEKGVLFLLIFTPLAIGTVQPWSTAVMELVSFTVFGAWILTLWHKQEIKIVLPPFLIAAAGLVLLVLLQLVPMPDSILAALSPATTRLYQQLSLPGDVSWRTISIRPEATWEELYKVLAYAAIFTVIINHYRTREQVSALVRAIVLIGTGLAFFGVLQKMTWNGNLFWIYPIREGLLPMGPYINRNHFAGYLEMAIPLGLGLILDRSARMGSYKQLPLLSRINAVLGDRYFPAIVFLSLAVLVMTGALFLSLSRGGMIGWSAGLFAFAMLARSKRSIRKRIVVIAGVGLAVLVLVVIAGWSRIEHRPRYGGIRSALCATFLSGARASPPSILPTFVTRGQTRALSSIMRTMIILKLRPIWAWPALQWQLLCLRCLRVQSHGPGERGTAGSLRVLPRAALLPVLLWQSTA
jgi:hypothetical protein